MAIERIRVIIESPYAGNVARNERYARACLADSLQRGEVPLAFHLLYAQPGVLRDTVPDERARGLDASRAWYYVAHLVAVYMDLGISHGMAAGMLHADACGVPTERRALPLWANGEPDTIRVCCNCKGSRHERTGVEYRGWCYACAHYFCPTCTFGEVLRGG